MVLTHDGQLLIVASDDRVAFIDSARLTAGAADAILGYLNDAPMAGRVYANVTPDDRWLFLSNESTRTISVVDLRRARASGFDSAAVAGQIPVGRAPIALTFSPDHRFLYTTSQVAPSTYGWPALCTPPPSEVVRQESSYAQGAILVVDVARATHDPVNAVIGAVLAGCNPVRLVTSPSGDMAYVRPPDRTIWFLPLIPQSCSPIRNAHSLDAAISLLDSPQVSQRRGEILETSTGVEGNVNG